ncbi:TPA: lipopolysaccharide kinase InaA family protein [Pseudomonas putida]
MGFPATDRAGSVEMQSYYGEMLARYWYFIQIGRVDRNCVSSVPMLKRRFSCDLAVIFWILQASGRQAIRCSMTINSTNVGLSNLPLGDILNAPGVWVEPPNVRRGGESGVLRIELDGLTFYKKQQVGHVYRNLRHPLGYPTVAREAKALRAAASLGVATPALLHSHIHKLDGEWQAVMLTAALDGYLSLEDFYAQKVERTVGRHRHLEILEAYGRVLAKLNHGRWQHGCLYLKHVFVDFSEPCVKVALLDLEKARKRFTAKQAARHDLRQVKRRSGWGDEEWSAFWLGYSYSFGQGAELLL